MCPHKPILGNDWWTYGTIPRKVPDNKVHKDIGRHPDHYQKFKRKLIITSTQCTRLGFVLNSVLMHCNRGKLDSKTYPTELADKTLCSSVYDDSDSKSPSLKKKWKHTTVFCGMSLLVASL